MSMKIKLSETYTAGQFKMIGPFRVTKRWKECPPNVIGTAEGFNKEMKEPLYETQKASSDKR